MPPGREREREREKEGNIWGSEIHLIISEQREREVKRKVCGFWFWEIKAKAKAKLANEGRGKGQKEVKVSAFHSLASQYNGFTSHSVFLNKNQKKKKGVSDLQLGQATLGELTIRWLWTICHFFPSIPVQLITVYPYFNRNKLSHIECSLQPTTSSEPLLKNDFIYLLFFL